MSKRLRLSTCAWSFLFVLAWVILGSPAYAHKVMVFAYQEGNRVYLEGYFADGKKTQNSLVEVFGEDGSKLLEGKTDKEGVFSFPMPDVPEVRIVLTGSMGHRAECRVKANADAAGPDGSKTPLSGGLPENAGRDKNIDVAVPGEDRIRAIVSEELDKKLTPLIREVALVNQDKPSLPDIIGGIGYIAGIMGLFMYFKARRRMDS